MIEFTYLDIINDTSRKAIIDYKYEGKDDSILYNKFISPLCQKIVDNHLPETLAPNLITTFGFLVNLFPHLLIVVNDAGEEAPVHRFLCLLQGLAILFYSVGVWFTLSDHG